MGEHSYCGYSQHIERLQLVCGDLKGVDDDGWGDDDQEQVGKLACALVVDDGKVSAEITDRCQKEKDEDLLNDDKTALQNHGLSGCACGLS